MLTILANFALIAFALWQLFYAEPQSRFRIDARSDTASFISAGELRWGKAAISTGDPATKGCAAAALSLPAGTGIELRRGTQGSSVEATAPAGQSITLLCGPDDERRTAFVAVKPAVARSTGVLVAALPIAGTGLRVGDGPDADSPIESTQLLHSGTIATDLLSDETAPVSQPRALLPGEIVSLDPPLKPGEVSEAPTSFNGLLLFDAEGARILTRSIGKAVYVTETNAPDSKAALVAPTLLARLQAKAEWGVWLLIGAAVLNIMSALRTQLVEKESMFAWATASAKPTAAKTRPARKRTAKAALLAGFAVLVALAAPRPAFAQQLAEHAVFRIEGPSGQGQGFAIANPRGTPKCLIVTVAHVVQPGDAVTLIGELPNTVSGQTAALRAPAKYLDVLAPGLVVLEPTGGQDLGACAPLAQPERADAIYEGDGVGRLSFVDPLGERRSLRLIVDGDPRLSRMLKAKLITDDQVGPGLSGSPISINGRILALAEQVVEGSGEVTRIDSSRLNPAYTMNKEMPSVPNALQPNRPWGAFDFDRLPQPYKDVVWAAYRNAKEAEVMQITARQNAILADDAALKARGKVPGYGNGNVSDKDRIYEGQVAADGVGQGWGVLKIITGAGAGEDYRGHFQRTEKGFDVVGPTVFTIGLSGAVKNQVKWEGQYEKGLNGAGVLTFRNGDTNWSKWARGVSDVPGLFQRASDNARWYVGFKNGRFDGPGVMYWENGYPRCICVWRDGEVLEDNTQAIIAATR